MVKLSGWSKLYPYSYDNTADSDKGLLQICNLPLFKPSEISLIAFHSYSVF